MKDFVKSIKFICSKCNEVICDKNYDPKATICIRCSWRGRLR